MCTYVFWVREGVCMGRAEEELLREIFPGDSEMSRVMRAHDWAATPLGDPATWPDGLRIPLSMLLTSRFEMWLGWGPDLCFFYNDAYIPTLGIKHPSMLGKPFREVWSEVYHEVADQVEKVRAGEATWNKALLLLLERSGYPEETYHSFSYSPLYGPTGAVDGMLCIVSEETERVISERRLDMLRSLGMKLVGAMDRDEVLRAAREALGANRRDFPFAFIDLLGPQGAERLACSGTVPPDLIRPLEDLDGLGMGGRYPLSRDHDYPCGDWAIPPVEAAVVPISGGAGQPAMGALVLGLNPHRRDGTESVDLARLLAAQLSGALANVEQLRSERRRADRVWTHSRDLMVTVDGQGIFRSASPAWTRVLGHSEEEVVGRSFRDFVSPEDMDRALVAHREALEINDLAGFECRFRDKQGNPHWLSWQTAQEDGLIYGYGRDITEEKAHAEALASAEDALRQAQKMEAVGQLTGGIAHDFNNLLTGLIGSLELLQRKTARIGADDLKRHADLAMTSANRAASLTQRLLAFSRRQTLAPKPLEANRLVSEMEELLRRTIGETIRLELRLGYGIGRIKCDPNQLESAILNLAINARDAMPEGGTLSMETRDLHVEEDMARENAVAPGGYVTICVSDTGHGMSEEVIGKAFEPFFTTKLLGEGTGLGLSMIYGFVRQSGGFVTIDSSVGQGTSVCIHMPRSVEAPAVELPSESEVHPAKGECTVLIVEDEPVVRALVVEVLSELGYRTIEARDGPAGLDILRSAIPIDLLVTDIGLPGMNGRQLAEAARIERPGLKVIFVTGYEHKASERLNVLGPGMDIITKPFTMEKLATRVQSMVEA